jgi:hypothetical protein
MSANIFLIRDTLTLDESTIMALNAAGGDTSVVAVRDLTLSALLASSFNYIIAADTMTVVPGARTSMTGGPGPAVTILARTIGGAPLSITSAGSPGEDGTPGEPGESGIEQQDGGGKVILLPGGAGGNGGAGGSGGPGGAITIRYAVASFPPTGSAPGGLGGAGGPGGPGGAGKPHGKSGRNGRQGKNGVSGKIDIQQVAADQVWELLDTGITKAWAAYRAEVAAYYFRKFDPASQLQALDEVKNAVAINPADAQALAIRDRIANRQIPSGLARDLDIAPDFRGLSANLPAEVALVQNAFHSYVSVVQLETIADSIRDSLQLMANQLADRRAEAQVDVAIARQDIQIAQAEIDNVDLQIKDLDQQIEQVRQDRFSITGVLSDVGAIAGVVAGMATGVGAIVSVVGGLATLQRVAEGIDLVQFIKFLNESPDPNSRTSDDIQDIKKLGGGMKDLITGANSFISFGKVLGDLDNAMSLPGQDAIGKLLKQQVLLVRQKMVDQLRKKQAEARVAVATMRVDNLFQEMQQVQQTLAHWSADAAVLAAATDLLIRSARDVVDLVMEDVFLAQRAREIYELDRLTELRFDFGFLHPDVERALTPAQRAAASLVSLSGMAVQVLAWDKIFQQLNTAQIGFDVIHPQLSVSIIDAAKLRDFASGAALEFSIDLANVPPKMFELKVNALTLELVGASTNQSANVWITHSGDWKMNRRTDGTVTELLLLPRSELFAFSHGSGTLNAKIPANPQSSSEPGPPFSFWGRGVATTFRLQVAPPSTLNLAQLSAIHLAIDCIGYAPQGAGAVSVSTALTPTVRTTRVASPELRPVAGGG